MLLVGFIYADMLHMYTRKHDGDLLTARRAPFLLYLAKLHVQVKKRKWCVQPLNENWTKDREYRT